MLAVHLAVYFQVLVRSSPSGKDAPPPHHQTPALLQTTHATLNPKVSQKGDCPLTRTALKSTVGSTATHTTPLNKATVLTHQTAALRHHRVTFQAASPASRVADLRKQIGVTTRIVERTITDTQSTIPQPSWRNSRRQPSRTLMDTSQKT